MQLKTLFIAAAAALVVSAETVTSFQKYIVVFKDVSIQTQITQVTDQIKEWGGKVLHEYTLIKAVAVEIPDNLLEKLEDFSQIDYVEEDGDVSISTDQDEEAL
ncbi:hypothetical protein BDR26DRAFT_876415 [Obelidium mucronatum]|nr:hypothetical protein BDR26DRAFT_876415 [Obelidium mucronatum]